MPQIRTSLVCIAALAIAALGAASEKPLLGTFSVDVVSLITDGKSDPGKPEFTADRLRYRYLFSSKEHRDAFLKQPEKFEVQLGGACGKMAELGGRGSTQRYWVYKGKLYVFASDGCRTGFQSNPEGHIERDEPQVVADSKRRGEARGFLDKAAKWSGLAQVKKGASISALQESELKQGSHTYKVKGVTRVATSGDYYDVTTYDGTGYANQIAKGKAVEIDPKGVATEHVPTWKRALERQRARNLTYILLNRNSKAMTTKSEGVSDGVASVVVNIDGATSILWIEAATGKVISQTFKGRNRSGIIGDVQLDFSSYETKDGVTLPVEWSATYNGQDSPIHYRAKMKLAVARE